MCDSGVPGVNRSVEVTKEGYEGPEVSGVYEVTDGDDTIGFRGHLSPGPET